MRAALILLSLPIWAIGLAMVAYSAVAWLVTGRSEVALRWLVSLDQLGNTLAFGDPDETISSRAGKCARKGGCRFCYWLCRFLHWLDPQHCERHIEADEGER